MQTSGFNIKVIDYIGNTGYINDQYQALVKLET